MTGLVDCNNFFVSCERTRRPELCGRAVVVLSNNDGCVVARSNEAKALGIKMGQPAFQLRDLINSDRVVALSGNHLLYHDISVAVHDIFRRFAPATIDYSIDEAFLDISGIPLQHLPEIGMEIYRTCLREEGIPVTIGFAPTKTIAKIASHVGKKSRQPVCLLADPAEIALHCSRLPIGELWGIGRRLARRMYMDGIHTIAQLADTPLQQVRSAYGLNTERTWLELHGTDCITLEAKQRQWQDSVSETRTFRTDISDPRLLEARISLFATHCAQRLREFRGGCRRVGVMLRTNRFRTDIPPYYPTAEIEMPQPTSSTTQIIAAALQVFRTIYRPEYPYKRAGVLLSCISDMQYRQPDLFDPSVTDPQAFARGPQDPDSQSNDTLMQTIDRLNTNPGHPLIRPASQMGIGSPPPQEGYSSSFGFK